MICMDPAGRALFLVDATDGRRASPRPGRWSATSSAIGHDRLGSSGDGHCLRISNTDDGLRTTIEIYAARDSSNRWSSGRSPSRTSRALRERSRWCRTWSGCSTVRRPTGGIPSTTGCSPRSSTSARLQANSGLGQALADDGAPRRGSRSGRVPVLADRFHRPRQAALVAAGAGNPGVLGSPRHRCAPDLRPDRQPAPRHDHSRARVVPAPPVDWSGEGQGAGDRPDRAPPRAPDGAIRRRGVAAGRRPTRSGMARSRREHRSLTGVLRGRPKPLDPHAVHSAAFRPHPVQRALATSLW